MNAFWTAVLGILYFHIHVLFITLKPKFWPLAFAIFLDSVEILMCVKTVHFMFWFRFPTQALLCYSRQWSNLWISLATFVTDGLPSRFFLCNLCIPLSLLLEVIRSLARRIDNPVSEPTFSLSTEQARTFPLLGLFSVILLCVYRLPLPLCSLKLYPAFKALLKSHLYKCPCRPMSAWRR